VHGLVCTPVDQTSARPVHQIISMIKWIRTSRLSIKNALSAHLSTKASDDVRGRGRRQRREVCLALGREMSLKYEPMSLKYEPMRLEYKVYEP